MKHVSNKVELWELQISGFRYEIFHISGKKSNEENLLYRWGSRNQPPSTQGSIQALLRAPNAPYSDVESRWTRLIDLAEVQKLAVTKQDEAINLDKNRNGL